MNTRRKRKYIQSLEKSSSRKHCSISYDKLGIIFGDEKTLSKSMFKVNKKSHKKQSVKLLPSLKRLQVKCLARFTSVDGKKAVELGIRFD